MPQYAAVLAFSALGFGSSLCCYSASRVKTLQIKLDRKRTHSEHRIEHREDTPQEPKTRKIGRQHEDKTPLGKTKTKNKVKNSSIGPSSSRFHVQPSYAKKGLNNFTHSTFILKNDPENTCKSEPKRVNFFRQPSWFPFTCPSRNFRNHRQSHFWCNSNVFGFEPTKSTTTSTNQTRIFKHQILIFNFYVCQFPRTRKNLSRLVVSTLSPSLSVCEPGQAQHSLLSSCNAYLCVPSSSHAAVGWMRSAKATTAAAPPTCSWKFSSSFTPLPVDSEPLLQACSASRYAIFLLFFLLKHATTEISLSSFPIFWK